MPVEVLRAAQELVDVHLEAVVALEDQRLPAELRGLLAELFRGRLCRWLVSFFADQLRPPAVACTTMLAGRGRTLHGLRLRLACTQQQWQRLLEQSGRARELEVPGEEGLPPLRVCLRAGRGLSGVPPPSVMRLRLQLPPAAAWLSQLELPQVAAALAGAGLDVQQVSPVLGAGGLRSATALSLVVSRDPALPALRGRGVLALLLPAVDQQPAVAVEATYLVQSMPVLPPLRCLQPSPPRPAAAAAAAPAPAAPAAPAAAPAPVARPAPAATGSAAAAGASPSAAPPVVTPAAPAAPAPAAGGAPGAPPPATRAQPAAQQQRLITAFLQPPSAQPAPSGTTAAPPPVGRPSGAAAAAAAAAAAGPSTSAATAPSTSGRAPPQPKGRGLASGFLLPLPPSKQQQQRPLAASGSAAARPPKVPPARGASGAAGAAAPATGGQPAAPVKRPPPQRSGSSSSGSGAPAKRAVPLPSWAQQLRACGFVGDDFDLDVDLDDAGWSEEEEELDFGGVPMRDESGF